MSDFLFVIEDPGAANYLMPVYKHLKTLQGDVHLWASKKLQPLLHDVEGVRFWRETEELDTFPIGENIGCVVVGTSENPDSLCLKIVSICQERGIPCVGGIDGPANPAHRFRGRSDQPLAYCPDQIFVPDGKVAQSYEELGLSPDVIHVVGHPQFDNLEGIRRQLDEEGRSSVRGRLFPDIDPERRLIVFCSELSDGLDPKQFCKSKDYKLQGWGESEGRTEIVLEEVFDGIKHSMDAPALVIRLHPKNSQDDYRAYDACVDGYSAGGSPYEAVYAADLVIGLSSIILFEAALLGCQTLSILPRECEKSWLGSIDAGLTPCVTSSNAIEQFFKNWTDTGWGIDKLKHPDIALGGATQKMVEILRMLKDG